jgi:deoxyribodipyrimidine photo-lyase
MAVRGGRSAASEQLLRARQLGQYAIDRNMPALSSTTRLSACNKFGVLSIREVYHAIKDDHGEDHALIGELYWRDFFTHLAFHFPRVFEGPFDLRFRKLSWQNDETKFESFCRGETGYPIVDAGIRELLQTGYMHNRVRMIVASFLVKDLHTDWRWGERFFAQHLIDYDPCVNNGNWQWSASTGADAAPYFRIFNPWTQQLRFDPEGEYIRRWVDELRGMDPEELYALSLPDASRPRGYALPIVDHKSESIKTKTFYQRALADLPSGERS